MRMNLQMLAIRTGWAQNPRRIPRGSVSGSTCFRQSRMSAFETTAWTLLGMATAQSVPRRVLVWSNTVSRRDLQVFSLTIPICHLIKKVEYPPYECHSRGEGSFFLAMPVWFSTLHMLRVGGIDLGTIPKQVIWVCLKLLILLIECLVVWWIDETSADEPFG